MKAFDRKFGRDFVLTLPTSPAVYLFKDAGGRVLYVGKAKNVRRRLAQYRNASRRKAHRKMRMLVREAASLEIQPQASETDALLVENRLIRTLRPPFNVDGAFDFLYPAIGTGHDGDRLVLCFTSDPDRFDGLDLEWHGTFRPRWRAREAYDALTMLFGHLGHAEPRSRLPVLPDRRGARVFAARRIPREFLRWTRGFLDGNDGALLVEVSTRLLERSAARRAAGEIEEALHILDEFYREDARRLWEARLAAGRTRRFVPQAERDGLFIRVRGETEPEALSRA